MKIFENLDKIKILSKHYKLSEQYELKCSDYDLSKKHVTIIIINQCNLHCKFCRGGIDKNVLYEQSNVKVMGIDVFKRVIDKCCESKVKSIDLTPPIGELLLDENLFEKLDYLESNCEIETFVFTSNLIGLKKEHLIKLKKYKKMIFYISIYGYDEDSYKENTNTNKYNIFLEKLNMLYESCKSKGKEKLNVHFMVRSELENTDMHYALLKMCYEFGFKLVSSEKKNVNRAGNIDGAPLIKDERKGVCPYGPLLGGGIDQYGNVLYCPFNDIKKEGIVGNIFKNSLTEIYNGEKWKLIVDSHRNNNYNVSICKSCNETW